MHPDDPAETIMWLLRNNWDSNQTNTVTPQIHTGWYDYNRGGQQVTVTNPNENILNGGDTGITSVAGDGSTNQLNRGAVLVNCWAGTRDECQGVGLNGADVNPKTLAYNLAYHAGEDIVNAHSNGVIDGEAVYNSLAVNQTTRLPDTQGPKTVYRWELEVVYTYQS